MGLQRVRHNLTTEQQQKIKKESQHGGAFSRKILILSSEAQKFFPDVWSSMSTIIFALQFTLQGLLNDLPNNSLINLLSKPIVFHTLATCRRCWDVPRRNGLRRC